MSDAVKQQYEQFPYPARDPADEAKRLITGSPSRVAEIDHYLFQGRRDWQVPFRALVAGGGTGDGTVMLAQQLADIGAANAEVVYLDLSETARAVAEARVSARGLRNLRFLSGSLLELPRLNLGRFDYIDCCGVLHHLADPPAGLAALVDALSPDGGIGLMVYGTFGREGLYPLQDALRQLSADLPLERRVELARRLLEELPPTNGFRRNPFLGDHRLGDAELVDLLLHSQDRAYTVPELAALAEGAGLQIASFIEPLRYAPETYLSDPELIRRAKALAPLERAALAERLAGIMKQHTVYLSRRQGSVAAFESLEAVPCLVDLPAPALARSLAKAGRLKLTLDGIPLELPVPPLAPGIVAGIDGRRSFQEIFAALALKDRRITRVAFQQQARDLVAALGGVNRLLLRTR